MGLVSSGLHPILVKLSVFILGQGTKRQPVNYGIPYLRFTGSVRLLTQISGQPMEQCYRKSVINLWVKKRVRPVILNDSTTPYASEFLAYYEKPGRFLASLDNHIGAIWYFIHHYNASLLV